MSSKGHGAIGGDTLAELRSRSRAAHARDHCDLVDRIDLAPERDIEHAVAMLVNIERL